mmetsp:Transcript_43234/g.70288  ORF Transcript_43234/g.70288 Transcript_43234/m.70288 type:complete len:199 (-) Transcript_43234:201-797(-)|eukprot:jgi/Bigna1/143567/aug1.79_g18275
MAMRKLGLQAVFVFLLVEIAFVIFTQKRNGPAVFNLGGRKPKQRPHPDFIFRDHRSERPPSKAHKKRDSEEDSKKSKANYKYRMRVRNTAPREHYLKELPTGKQMNFYLKNCRMSPGFKMAIHSKSKDILDPFDPRNRAVYRETLVQCGFDFKSYYRTKKALSLDTRPSKQAASGGTNQASGIGGEEIDPEGQLEEME